MATHSSILAWKIPWTGSLAGYSPWGHKKSDLTERLNNHNNKGKQERRTRGFFKEKPGEDRRETQEVWVQVQFCQDVLCDLEQIHSPLWASTF